ncbi:ClbS/DfsB family four-helix bundle protein [Ktedonosporobacter rubrisoli]|nr:ClbS/DfsB family four-helix bundle protein [Ktedonosporobacter rubrisoli]
MTAEPIKTSILDLLQQSQRSSKAFMQALDERERTAVGKPDFWSAKDHLAHMTYCIRQNLILKVAAILQQQEVSRREESVDQMNARVFEEHRLRPWEEVHVAFERVYADLIQLAERLSEAELLDASRFSVITEGHPLYTAFLGNGYEHLQEHFMQYYLERQNLPQAIQVREQCTHNVVKTQVPDWVKAWFLYDLASFYAQHKQQEQAAARLQEALTLAPERIEAWLKHNSELAAVRKQ